MALPLVIPGAFQIRLMWDIAGEAAVNVWGATAGSAVAGQPLADTVGSIIKSAWISALSPMMATTTSLVHVGVRDIRSPNQLEYIDSGAAVVGAGVGDPLPAQIALCVTLRTTGAGKRFRGRSYIGGWTETENAATGTSTPGADNAAVAFINLVATTLQPSGLGALGVLSRPAEASVTTKVTTHLDGTTTEQVIERRGANQGFITPIVLEESRSARWETQRRRGNGRGQSFSASTFVARASQLPAGQGSA